MPFYLGEVLLCEEASSSALDWHWRTRCAYSSSMYICFARYSQPVANVQLHSPPKEVSVYFDLFPKRLTHCFGCNAPVFPYVVNRPPAFSFVSFIMNYPTSHLSLSLSLLRLTLWVFLSLTHLVSILLAKFLSSQCVLS